MAPPESGRKHIRSSTCPAPAPAMTAGKPSCRPAAAPGPSGSVGAERSRGRPSWRPTLLLVLALWGLSGTGAHAREHPRPLSLTQTLSQPQQQVPRRMLEESDGNGRELGRVEEFEKKLSVHVTSERAARESSQDGSWSPGKASTETGPKEPFVLEDEGPRDWQQRSLRKHGLFSFVYYSAYRLSPFRISVVGFGATALREKRWAQGCAWVWRNGSSVAGELKIRLSVMNYNKVYEMVLLDCWLPPGPGEESAMEGEEGVLESSEPGYLRVAMDHEVFYPYREDHGYKIHPSRSKGPFQYNLAYCGPPMYGAIAPMAITQFIDYHRYHAGMDHFFFYDAGSITEELRQQLAPLESQGLVTVTPFSDILSYEVWAEGQFVQMHDCLYRTRETAQWVAFHDFDEYLEVPPPATLPGLLAAHQGKPFLTHGCYNYNVDQCEGEAAWGPKDGKYAVEMMLLRGKKPHCGGGGDQNPEWCLDGLGHRKFIYNPRMVFQTLVHRPEASLGPGIDLGVSEVRHAHFRGLLIEGRACKGTAEHRIHSTFAKAHEWDDPQYNPTDGERVTTIAEIAEKARGCAAQGFADKDKCSPGQPATT